MEPNKILSEYYFEYKLEKVLGDDTIATPKLYFERDYRDLSQYILYAVAEEWRDETKLAALIRKSNVEKRIKDRLSDVNETGRSKFGKNDKNTFWTIITDDNKVISEVRDLLPYDKIRIYYDTHGIDASAFTNAKAEAHKKFEVDNVEISLENFWLEEGCRAKILKDRNSNFSGVGQIEYTKNDKTVAKFFFAVNHFIRKKINYSLEREEKSDKLTLCFECDSAPVGIKVNLLAAQNRIPCLKTDDKNGKVKFNTEKGKTDVINIEFPSKRAGNKYFFKKEIDIPSDILDNTTFSLAFDDEDMEKYYLLFCTSNNTIRVKDDQDSKKKINFPSSCPYCHALMDSGMRYKKGGISCQGKPIKRGGKDFLSIQEYKKSQKTKNVIYCKEDIDKNGEFDDAYSRVLPKDFLSHKKFKVAFTGSIRAGKTTYISRLFNINKNGAKNGTVNFTLSMIKSSLERFNVEINHAAAPKVELENKVYSLKDTNWDIEQEYYQTRAIDLRVGAFPIATPSNIAFSRMPFCLEAGKIRGKSKNEAKSYISFYDVAGENAQKSQENIEIISGAKHDPIGIFLFVNGLKDSGSNDLIMTALSKANINKDSPVAVILTKFDILKGKFDGNCHCLRTDYLTYSYDQYDGSYLEKEIDISSEEVRSYLDQEAKPTLEIENKFNNVKYFALSSYNYSDSIIHQKNENENDQGEVKFESSAFRLELPLIWMLRQFGIVD